MTNNNDVKSALVASINSELHQRQLRFDEYLRKHKRLNFFIDGEKYSSVIVDYNFNTYKHDKDIWVVLEVYTASSKTTYYRIDGVHSSWMGTEWPHWETSIKEVVPEKITLTIWK